MISVTLLGPVLWALVFSFTRYGVYQDMPAFTGLENYLSILRDKGFKLSLKLTSLWAFLRVLIELSIAFALALRLRNSSRASRLAMLLLAIGWFIPSFISVSGWRSFIQGYGGYSLLNTLLNTNIDLTLNAFQAFTASLVVSVWLSLPLSTMIIIGMLNRVSREVDDMMKLDGAGDLAGASLLFGEIRYLLIPYGLFQLARATKEFTSVFLLSGSGPLLPEGFTPQTLTGATSFLGVVLFRKFSSLKDFGLLSAYSVYVGGFAVLWILAALFSRNEVPKRHRQILALSSLSHLLIGLFDGWRWVSLPIIITYALLPFSIPRFKKAFRVTITLVILYEVSINLYSFVSNGVSGIMPASLLSVPVILLSVRHRFPPLDFTLPEWLKKMSVVLIIIPTLVVIAYIFALSFSRDSEILPSLGDLTLANYSRVISDGLLKNIANTILITLWSFTISIFAVLPFSYIFSKSKRVLIKIITAVILFGSLYTGMHTLLPLYFVFDFLKITDTLFAIALVVSVQTMPVTIFVVGGFFSSVPRELLEASKIEGLSEPGYMWRVLLPLSLPVIGGILTYITVSAWSAFTLPLIILKSGNLQPFSLKVFSYAGEIRSYYTSWNLFGAASVIGVIPLLVFFRAARSLIFSSDLRDMGVEYD